MNQRVKGNTLATKMGKKPACFNIPHYRVKASDLA